MVPSGSDGEYLLNVYFNPLKVSEMIENKNEIKDQNMLLVKYCESERINTELKFGSNRPSPYRRMRV
jgi:hypothetical protein